MNYVGCQCHLGARICLLVRLMSRLTKLGSNYFGFGENVFFDS